MEMVSASKMGKAERNARGFVPYSDKIQALLQVLQGVTQMLHNSMLEKRPVKKTGYLVITSDKGLVGAYNSHVLKKVS